MLKDISEEYDFLKMSISIKLIILYLQDRGLSENKVETEGKKISNSIEDDTIGWFNSVKKGSNHN